MSFRRRLERLEGRRDPEPCPACGSKIIHAELTEDGFSYPEGDMPCLECGNAGWGSVPGMIVICPPLR